jgi:hypothetical protein
MCATGGLKSRVTAEICHSAKATRDQMSTRSIFIRVFSNEPQSQPRRKPSSVTIATRNVIPSSTEVGGRFQPVRFCQVNGAGEPSSQRDRAHHRDGEQDGHSVIARVSYLESDLRSREMTQPPKQEEQGQQR